MSISFTSSGNFSKTEQFLKNLKKPDYIVKLGHYGQKGVEALRAATPKDSGETANGWYYKIETKGDTTELCWCNRHLEKGVNIAILLQYGHATRNGGYVQGIDYINPALAPIMDAIEKELIKEV